MRRTEPTVQTLQGLDDLLKHNQWVHGWEVIRRTGQRGGRVYPVLHRFVELGWLESTPEVMQPADYGQRPARIYYRWTELGKQAWPAFRKGGDAWEAFLRSQA